MKQLGADIGIAEGKVRISLSLPRQLVAEFDVEAGRRRMEGEWLSRSEAIDLALASFFESGGLSSLDLDAQVPVPPEDRRSTTCHLRHELVAELRRQIIETQVTGWYWAQWEVTSAAIRRFIDTADISPPPESDCSIATDTPAPHRRSIAASAPDGQDKRTCIDQVHS